MYNFDDVSVVLWDMLAIGFGEELINVRRGKHSSHYHVARKLSSGGYILGRINIAHVDPDKEFRYDKYAPKGCTYMVHTEVLSNDAAAKRTYLHFLSKEFDREPINMVFKLQLEFKRAIEQLEGTDDEPR